MASKTKKCSWCKKTLSFDKFGLDPKTKTGRKSRCKACEALKAAESRKKNGPWMPHTPEQKQRQRDNEHRYKKSPKGLAAARVRDRKRRKTPEGRAMRKQYRESEKGRQAAVRGAAKRRARKLEQLCGCCDPNEREQAYAAGWIEEDCYICGAPADRTDHVIPLAAGKPGDGLHCIKNFRPICKDCNEAGGKWYTLWPAHLGWDESPGWEEFVTSKRALAVAT